MSSNVQYWWLAVLLNIPSISGNGDVILCVFLFRSRRSTTHRNWTGFEVFGFGINSIGTVFLDKVISHLPDFRYASLFSAHWSQKALGASRRPPGVGFFLVDQWNGVVYVSKRREACLVHLFVHYWKGIIFISRTVRLPLLEWDILGWAAAVGFCFRKVQNPFCLS